jgi:hypothetical protein
MASHIFAFYGLLIELEVIFLVLGNFGILEEGIEVVTMEASCFYIHR